MIEKETNEISDFDFGFSFHELETTEEVQKKELEQRLVRLHEAILPFLDNLCKNPDKETIKWPDRVAKILEFKEKLQNIVDGN